MRKAAVKRFKITKHKKLLSRKPGQNHFNAKKSRRTQRKKRKYGALVGQAEKRMRKYMM